MKDEQQEDDEKADYGTKDHVEIERVIVIDESQVHVSKHETQDKKEDDDDDSM